MRQRFQPEQLAQFAQDYQTGTSLSDILPQITDEFGDNHERAQRVRGNGF
jgi:hypothetical protein